MSARALPEGMPRPIEAVAEAAGLHPSEIERYSDAFAKVDLSVRERLHGKPRGKYVVVTAVTPTPLGEGKTTQSIALAMGLCAMGQRAIVCLRQPSQGPFFGRKGGGCGGGRSRLVPEAPLGLHGTGDLYAVAAAHNLLAAHLDSTLSHGNPLRIDPATITWTRVLDVSDRALRRVRVALGEGAERESGFEITAASEVMACLAMAEGRSDLRERLARIVVAQDDRGQPVTAGRLGTAGAMAALLREAVRPTLVSTCEGTPAFVHAGPFANVAQGNSSILADRIALGLAEFVVTEAGFGAEMGAEKFFNLKCRASGLVPDAAVLVTTVRALRYHGGGLRLRRGAFVEVKGVAAAEAVRRGCANLERQVANVRAHGIPVVVAVNAHADDGRASLDAIREASARAGAHATAVSRAYAEGAAGARDLAEAVRSACAARGQFRLLYEDGDEAERKIETVARTMYGAASVDFSPLARGNLDRIRRWGYGGLPVCMAKTQFSLSHDPALRGAPSGFVLPIREVRLAAGAGFLVVFCGEITTMPGLPSDPNLLRIDLDGRGEIVGL